jgi:hypothetical protein
MKRAVWVMAIMLLPSCYAAVSHEQEAQLRMLETVEKGDLCNPRALMQAVVREHPGIGPVTARRDTDHLLHVLGCGLSESESQEQPVVSSPVCTRLPGKGRNTVAKTGQ